MNPDSTTMPNLAALQRACVDGVIGQPALNGLYYCIRHPDERGQLGTAFAAAGRATHEAALKYYAYQLGICCNCLNNQERAFLQHANQRRRP